MTFRRFAGTLSGLALVAGALIVTSPGTANACVVDADGDCYLHVTGTVTATAGLNLRAAPWGTVLDTLPYNYSNVVDCYVQAPDSSYWDWIYDTRIGRSGWAYDKYLYTGGNIYQQVDEMHEGNCGSVPLAMPGNVSATAISTGAISVTWTDTNYGTAQYVVSNGNVSSADLAAGTTSYTWGGLAPGTYMCFFVAAKQSGQQSPWSPQACTTTWTLTAPSSVTATPVSTTAIRVTWNDPNGGASQYVVSNGNVSSADLAAGTTSYTWGGLAPGTYMCFTIAAKQSGQQSAWSPYGCTTTPIYVNMGDSFSSGEGTYGPYDQGTDVPGTNMCHRSPNSYSGQYAAMSSYWNKVTNVACTGAVTSDISNDPASPNSMQIPDQGQLAQKKYLIGNVGLVTITIGGNDLNLAGLIAGCLLQGAGNHDKTDKCFTNTFSNSFIAGITSTAATPNLVSTLESTYLTIKNAVPNAKIIVSTYPDIFPQTYTGNCTEGIFLKDILYLITSQNQLTQIHKVVTALDDAIKTAAAAVGLGQNVLDVQSLFFGHEVCTQPDSWVNQVTGINWLTQTYQDESLHPTTTGYTHWAMALKSFLGS